MRKTHETYLSEAIQIALRNQEQGGGPFGAIIVRNGEIIASSGNKVTKENDPTAHAEINAIRQACKHLGHFELSDCTLYSSCEPCPMCLGAIYWARMGAVYFAAGKADAKEAGFDDSFIYEELKISINQRKIPTYQMLREQALKPFENWKNREDKIEY